ncbi:histidine triad nucleotide-binding protein [candidate division KSB1 bacterium]|nr:histidine triad nucleotide-binding protein [candidate division KSB1 bacterium]RQW07165.1 MAG: histidine triad nucleotide-binding protein [candidate division KSB1 bacterium]
MNCIFCKIAENKVPARIIYQDDEILAFHDIAPQAPYHVLLIPRKHISTLNDAEESDTEILGKILLRSQLIAAQLGLSESGYRLVMNCNKNGGQSIYHIHCHLLGGRRMHWPPG